MDEVKTMKRMLFPPGQVVATPGALGLADRGANLLEYLARHLHGDWGDMVEADKEENDYSVSRHLRIFSAYDTPFGKLWLITEADRSVTTFLLPDEY
ncbi:hypothetical protein LCGC14_3168400 [marine sediment metagenome]|uniref:Plasmid related protein n=1 Tax=marine sediment metagenome TaxID=412755 RepID=A0A0F8XMZ6_9ZZZZ